jgi:hypothetical protein
MVFSQLTLPLHITQRRRTAFGRLATAKKSGMSYVLAQHVHKMSMIILSTFLHLTI